MNNETVELEEFILRGRSPFGLWFDSLQAVTAAKITVTSTRLKVLERVQRKEEVGD